MDVLFLHHGQQFIWDAEKAAANLAKHGIRFEVACDVFLDPLVRSADASIDEESREAAIGTTEDWKLLFVVHLIAKTIGFESFQRAQQQQRKGNSMKKVTERIKQRLSKDRQMTTISLRVPQDVIDDLKEIAPTLGFSGYQPLMKAYIGQGLRKDLERMNGSQIQALTESLRKQGIADEKISAAIAEAGLKTA